MDSVKLIHYSTSVVISISFISSIHQFILLFDSAELLIPFIQTSQAWSFEMPHDDLLIVSRISTAVMDRSAAIAAILVAACAHKTGRLQAAFGGLSVGIDGSLYKKNSEYRNRVRHHLDAILGQSRSSLVHLLLADDGSGKGAGILAATLAHL